MKNMKKLKEKIQTKKKKIGDKFSEGYIGLYDKLFERSLTTIGSLIRKVRSECYILENGNFDQKEYIKRLYKFYCVEFEDKCSSSGWNYNKELLLRRKEVKNQSNFLANVSIAIATGVLVGLFVNNINKFGFLLSGLNDDIKIMLLKIIIVFVLFLIISFLPAFIFIVFKNSITMKDPIIEYLEEVEIEIIEKIMRDIFNLEDDSTKP